MELDVVHTVAMFARAVLGENVSTEIFFEMTRAILDLRERFRSLKPPNNTLNTAEGLLTIGSATTEEVPIVMKYECPTTDNVMFVVQVEVSHALGQAVKEHQLFLEQNPPEFCDEGYVHGTPGFRRIM